jgi:hypothetical protein
MIDCLCTDARLCPRTGLAPQGRGDLRLTPMNCQQYGAQPAGTHTEEEKRK